MWNIPGETKNTFLFLPLCPPRNSVRWACSSNHGVHKTVLNGVAVISGAMAKGSTEGEQWTRPRWEIVGGQDRGGVLVREGVELSSARCPARLSTGAIVEEICLQEERLHFRRITGSGQSEGWISIRLDHKELAVKLLDAPGSGRNETIFATLALPDSYWNPGETGEETRSGQTTVGRNDEAGEKEKEDDECWQAAADLTALWKIPAVVESHLKWFIWNQIWKQFNGKIAGFAKSTVEREQSLRRAQDDADRICTHLRDIEATHTITRKTIQYIKAQAEAVGDATVSSVKCGKWLIAAQAEALNRPSQFDYSLWEDIVACMRSAGVAIFFTCSKGAGAKPYKDDFDVRWNQLTEGG